MTSHKITTATLTMLAGAAAALTLTTGPAAAAPAPTSFAGFSAGNDQLVFRSSGDVDNTLTVTAAGSQTPDDPFGDRITWTFTDKHPIATSGEYCSHPGGKANVVACFREYGESGTTGDLPLRIHLGAGDDGARIDSTYTFDDRVYGEAGNDRIRVTDYVGLVDGGAGNDTLLGVRTKVSSNEKLQLDGGIGNDTIDFGDSPGDLSVRAGAGNDVVHTGRGNDRILADSGDDRVTAGPGNDYVDGAAGRDVLYGNSGNDRLIGGPGVDRISGGPGRNTIRQ